MSYFLESPSKSRIYSNISRTSLFFAIVTIEIKEVFKKEHIVRRERYMSCISTTNSKSLYHYQVQIFYDRALILIALVRLIGSIFSCSIASSSEEFLGFITVFILVIPSMFVKFFIMFTTATTLMALFLIIMTSTLVISTAASTTLTSISIISLSVASEPSVSAI